MRISYDPDQDTFKIYDEGDEGDEGDVYSCADLRHFGKSIAEVLEIRRCVRLERERVIATAVHLNGDVAFKDFENELRRRLASDDYDESGLPVQKETE